MAKKIFVFTATGDQGSSVCRYLLEDGPYEVTGLTRNTESDKAKELAKLGVKLVKGDMEDRASYEAELKGMDGAFINADFWATYYANGFDSQDAGKKEGDMSKAAVDACKAAGVGHVVYSTLDDIEYCPHFVSKAGVTKYIQSTGLPATQLYTSHYFNNLTKFYMLQPQDDGTVLCKVPALDSCVLPQYAVEQTGAWVLAAFKDPKKWIGGSIYACSDKRPLSDLAKLLSDLSGKKVVTRQLSEDQFWKDNGALKKEIGEELWIQYKMFQQGDMHRDIEESKAIVPDQWDLKAWAMQSKDLKKLLSF